jgi:hypothetical protein
MYYYLYKEKSLAEHVVTYTPHHFDFVFLYVPDNVIYGIENLQVEHYN